MTPNTLPPGLSEKDFNDALAEFRRIVGDAHVFTGDALAPYRDPYSIEDDAKFSTPAAVAPDSAEQVQAVVKVANQYGVPLWTISAGKNHGYGGAAPRMSSHLRAWLLGRVKSPSGPDGAAEPLLAKRP